jgi:hypothetical protein
MSWSFILSYNGILNVDKIFNFHNQSITKIIYNKNTKKIILIIIKSSYGYSYKTSENSNKSV